MRFATNPAIGTGALRVDFHSANMTRVTCSHAWYLGAAENILLHTKSTKACDCITWTACLLLHLLLGPFAQRSAAERGQRRLPLACLSLRLFREIIKILGTSPWAPVPHLTSG